MKVPQNLDYIIVLGAHVDGRRLTLALLERTRRAFEYLKDIRRHGLFYPVDRDMENR